MGTGVLYIRVCRVFHSIVWITATAEIAARGSEKSERPRARLFLAETPRFGNAHGIADGSPDVAGFDPGFERLSCGPRTQGAQSEVGVQGGGARLTELLVHEDPVERVPHQGLAASRGAEYPSG